jgi:hypothetical protein
MDDDYRYIQSLLTLSLQEWEHAYHKGSLKVYKKKNHRNGGESHYTLKCYLTLPKIPKVIAFKALADMKLRPKWDNTLHNFHLIEDDRERDIAVFTYHSEVPVHMQTRESVILKKVQKDFPKKGAWTLVNLSTDHSSVQNDPKVATRMNTRVNAIIFEDLTEAKGTKLTWFIDQDYNGCMPHSLLESEAIKLPKLMQKELVKACELLIKNKLK